MWSGITPSVSRCTTGVAGVESKGQWGLKPLKLVSVPFWLSRCRSLASLCPRSRLMHLLCGPVCGLPYSLQQLATPATACNTSHSLQYQPHLAAPASVSSTSHTEQGQPHLAAPDTCSQNVFPLPGHRSVAQACSFVKILGFRSTNLVLLSVVPTVIAVCLALPGRPARGDVNPQHCCWWGRSVCCQSTNHSCPTLPPPPSLAAGGPPLSGRRGPSDG